MGERQRQIYEFIKSYIETNKYSPTIRGIGVAVRLSSSSVHGHLYKMREKGYIDFVNSSPRTLQIV